MATLKKFEELDVWKDSIHLAKEIYLLTQQDLFKNDWSLKDQIRRAAVSVSNNIAEGFEYNNNNFFIKYLKIAKGSCGEVRSMIQLLHEINYIDEIQKDAYLTIASELSNKIGGLLKYLNQHKQNTLSNNKPVTHNP